MWKTIKTSLCMLIALAFCAGITLVSVVCFHSELQRQQEECLSAHRNLDQYRDNHQWRKAISTALKPVGMGWLSGYEEPEIGNSCDGWLVEALHENPALKTASQWTEEIFSHPLLEKVVPEIEAVYSHLFENARVVKQSFRSYLPIVKEFFKDENLKSMARYAMNQLKKTPKEEEAPQKESSLSMYYLALVMSLSLAAAVVFYSIKKRLVKQECAKSAEKNMTKKDKKAAKRISALETKAEINAMLKYINTKSPKGKEEGFAKKLASGVSATLKMASSVFVDMLVSAATYCNNKRKYFEKEVNKSKKEAIRAVNKEIEEEGNIKKCTARVVDMVKWVGLKLVDMVKWVYHKLVSAPKDDSESSEVKVNKEKKEKKWKNKKGKK